MYILSARECMIVNNLYNSVINNIIPVRVRLSYNTRYLRKAGYYLGWRRHGGIRNCSPSSSQPTGLTVIQYMLCKCCFLNTKISALLAHFSKIQFLSKFSQCLSFRVLYLLYTHTLEL